LGSIPHQRFVLPLESDSPIRAGVESNERTDCDGLAAIVV